MQNELRDDRVPSTSLDDANELIGNEIEREATWKSGADLQTHAGQAVRMRIVARDADVYAFRFAD